jgi:hypothetical protein
MSTFELTSLTPEIQQGLEVIGKMADATITIRQITVIEIANEAVCSLVKTLLARYLVEPIQQPKVIRSDPAPRKFEPRPAAERNCAACGQPLDAEASANAKFCVRPECKKARWRKAAQENYKAKKQPEKDAETAIQPPDLKQMLGAEAIAVSPDPLAQK